MDVDYLNVYEVSNNEKAKKKPTNNEGCEL